MFAKTEVQWLGKGGSKGPEVNMRTKSPLSSYEEVKNLWRKESDVSKGDLSLRWKRKERSKRVIRLKVQEDNRIKFGMLWRA